MDRDLIKRRTFLKGAGLTLAALSGMGLQPGYAALYSDDGPIQVPFSSGTQRAKTKMPPNATDCHHHIYDSSFGLDPNSTLRPPDASIADYRLLQKRLGTTRDVIIQPSTYGVDNHGLASVLEKFGLATTRGVAVVNTEVTDAELKKLDAVGVRGIRINLAIPGGATNMEMVKTLAGRVAPFGWHIQINATDEQILEGMDVWESVPCQIVFDHFAHVPEPDGANHPVFFAVVSLMQKGKAWVKLSAAYQESKVGPPTYADSGMVARAFVREAPDRLVWGTNWPHPTEKHTKPDDALLLDLLAEWVPDEAIRNRILVDNPAKLYGFTK
ncbi:MAG: amidohydrolase family protein [Negativicutes bacterium]|nr:amidohydrolase family protein [Negativicutes bacterium]